MDAWLTEDPCGLRKNNRCGANLAVVVLEGFPFGAMISCSKAVCSPEGLGNRGFSVVGRSLAVFLLLYG